MARKTPITSKEKSRAAALRKLRKASGMSVTVSGLICGFSRECMANYECGRVPITPARFKPILDAFRAHIETQRKALAEFKAFVLSDPEFLNQFRALNKGEALS